MSQLHNVMQSRIIFRGIAPSHEALAEPLKRLLKKDLTLYKEQLRPILTGECRVFRHAEQNGVLDPAPWSVNEFASPEGDAAYVVVQRLAAGDTDTFLLRPKGIRGNQKYRVCWDRSGNICVITGVELMLRGVPVSVDTIIGSELLTITKIKEDESL